MVQTLNIVPVHWTRTHLSTFRDIPFFHPILNSPLRSRESPLLPSFFQMAYFFLNSALFSFIFSFFALTNNSKCPARSARLLSVLLISPDDNFFIVLRCFASWAFLGAMTRGPSFDDDLFERVLVGIFKRRGGGEYFLAVVGFAFFNGA